MHARALGKQELLALLPRNRDEQSRARALAKLGDPAAEPVLEQLIDWLRTNDWPVDPAQRPSLAELGAPAIPVVRRVLRARHD